MLDWDDQDLVSRDPALPGLASVLDPERLAEELVTLGLDDLGPIELDYVRYKPGISCLVRFSLGDSPRPVHVVTYGIDAAAKAEKARARALRGSEPGALHEEGGCAYSSRMRALFSFFPFDPDLPSIARLFDPARGAALRARIFDALPEVPSGPVQMLAYKPGRRFVARLGGHDADGPGVPRQGAPGAAGRSGDFVLRFHGSLRPERATRVLDRLSDDASLALPRRRGGSKRHRVAAVDWIEGANLRDRIRGSDPPSTDLLERVANALHSLHRQVDAMPGHASTPSPAEGLTLLARDLEALVPGIGDLAAQLATRLEAMLARIEPIRCLVHGDFYDKQVVLCAPDADVEERVGIVDLDDLRHGDPREDLGLCCAHWERDHLMKQLGHDPAALGAALIDAYQRRLGLTLPFVEVFVAAGLLRLAPHPFRTRAADWQQHVASILLRVSELLERAA